MGELKRTCSLVTMVILFGWEGALAAPTGFDCIAGEANLGVCSDSVTRVESQGRTIIQWNEFSIGQTEKVIFSQQGSDAAVLNRVLGRGTSELLGALQSNGMVYLINPNGVLIGPEARIESSGFLASMADVLNADFLKGQEMLFVQRGGEGAIIHRGKIDCPAGDVFLFAVNVINEGEITAPQGHVGIACGSEILLQPWGSERVFIKSECQDPALTHSGKIEAVSAELKTSGTPFSAAIRSTGEINALSFVTEADGRILLKAENGRVDVDGRMTADSIHILGDEVRILGNARLDACGSSNGGEILIGGDYKGSNLEVLNASRTYVADGALVSASALKDGSGGKIVIWSNERTVFAGHLEATGFTQGGFAEVSGASLSFSGSSDLRAAHGPVGTLLLDPRFIVIDPAGAVFVGPTDPFGNNVGGTDTFTGASLAGVINTSAVFLQANTDVTFQDTVTTAAAPAGSLTVQAGRSIIFNAAGLVTLNGGAAFSATINDSAAMGGDRLAGPAQFTMNAGSNLTTATGPITIAHGNLDASGSGNVSIAGTMATTSGTISITGDGYGGAAVSPNIEGILLSGTGSITGGGPITLIGTGGATTVSGNAHGIAMTGTSSITQNGSGLLTMTGNSGVGGTVGSCHGISLAPGTVQTTSTGNIVMTGATTTTSAATSSIGILVSGGTVQSTSAAAGAGTITMTGTGSPNTSASNNYGIEITTSGVVTSVAGAISLDGRGGGTGAGGHNVGIEMDLTAQITSTGSAPNAATITLVGTNTGTATGTTSHGIEMAGLGFTNLISTVDGAVLITGTGAATGTMGSNTGFRMIDATAPGTAGLRSTGSGSITVNGFGGGTGGTAQGISLEDSRIESTGTGTLNLNGTGSATSSGIRNNGVHSVNSRVVTSAGNISILGNAGGNAVSSFNDGVFFNGGVPSSIIETTGTGNISIQGTAATSASTLGDNNGVQIACVVRSTSAANGGTITITGTGNPLGTSENDGIDFTDGANVTTVSGAITIIGTGGGTTTDNNGVHLQDLGFGAASPLISTSGTGSISISGTGRTIGATTTDNNGIKIESVGSTISTTGSGNVTLSGTGSTVGTSQNQGIRITNSGLVTTTGSGTLDVRGTGGGNGTGTNNVGIDIDGSGDITSTMSGAILLTGTGGNGTTNNHGIQISDAGSTVTSSGSGPITMDGSGSTAAAATSTNQGIQITTSGLVTTTGTGNISATGTGGGNGTGTNNVGIDIEGMGDITSTVAGNISLSGQGGNGTADNHGVQVSDMGTFVLSNGSGTITVVGNGSSLAAAASTNQGVQVANMGIIQSTNAQIDVQGNGGGNGTGTNNIGVELTGGGQINGTLDAPVSVTGQGGSGTANNFGVYVTGFPSQISGVNGAVTVTGAHGLATEEDIVVELSGAISSFFFAPINLIGTIGDILIQDAGGVFSFANGFVTANAADDIRLEGGTMAGQPAIISLNQGSASLTAGDDVILTGGSGASSFAQIGSDAVSAFASIFINAGGDVVVDAGDTNSYAIIGHGGPGANANQTGDITINAFNVFVNGATAGAGTDGFAQIGHVDLSGTMMDVLVGNITIDVFNDIVLTGGAFGSTTARIGHGGMSPTTEAFGNMLLIADVDIRLLSNTGLAEIENLSTIDSLTCVVDDAFPTSCAFGPGEFELTANSLIETNGGELRIYTAQPAQNFINELINGAPFIPGPFNVNTTTETWQTYYPDGAYGGALFNIYYKIPCVVTEEIVQQIFQLNLDTSQLTMLLPIYLYRYEDYPYHPKMCIRECWTNKKCDRDDWVEECEPQFLRFDSMMFENFVR